jgi:hypothetical protein
VPTVIDAIASLSDIAGIRSIQTENPLLLGVRQIGPHHTDENICESDYLLPGKPTQTFNVGDAFQLTPQ